MVTWRFLGKGHWRPFLSGSYLFNLPVLLLMIIECEKGSFEFAEPFENKFTMKKSTCIQNVLPIVSKWSEWCCNASSHLEVFKSLQKKLLTVNIEHIKNVLVNNTEQTFCLVPAIAKHSPILCCDTYYRRRLKFPHGLR